MPLCKSFKFSAKYSRQCTLALILLGMAVLFSPTTIFAADCITTGSGNWSGAIWSGCSGGIPTTGDSVTIANGHTVTLDVDPTILGFTINAGGTLQPAVAGTHVLTVNENFTNNGTLTTNNGSGKIDIVLGGTGVKLFYPGATTSYNNLTVNTRDYGRAGFWKFDEGTGFTAGDSSGTLPANNGTLVGGTSWTTTAAPTAFANPSALSFDGSNGTLVSVPNSTSLNFDTNLNFSLAVWIRSNSAGIQPDGTGIIVKGNNGAEQYALDLDSNGYVRFTVRDNAGVPYSIVGSGFGAITSARGWTHIGATMDGGTNLLTLYVNSFDILSIPPTLSLTPPVSLLANSHEVSIGSRQSGSTTYDRTFNGLIDDVRIYNRAIAGDEILRLHRGWFPNAVELTSGLIVKGNLNLESTSLDVTEPNHYPVTLEGNLVNNCCFQPRAGTFTFQGAGIHTITGSSNSIRFSTLTIPDNVIVEAGAAPATIVNTINLGTNLWGQFRRTPSGNTAGDCSAGAITEKDATNNTTITLSNCNGTGFTTANIRTARGGWFPNADLAGSSKYDTCPASSNLVRRFWQIEPNGSGIQTATVTFYYLPSELNGNTATALHVYKCSNGSWIDVGVPTYGSSGAYNTVTLANVPIGSGYGLAQNSPTAVKVSSFDASSSSLMNPGTATWTMGWIVLPGVLVLGALWWRSKSRV